MIYFAILGWGCQGSDERGETSPGHEPTRPQPVRQDQHTKGGWGVLLRSSSGFFKAPTAVHFQAVKRQLQRVPLSQFVRYYLGRARK